MSDQATIVAVSNQPLGRASLRSLLREQPLPGVGDGHGPSALTDAGGAVALLAAVVVFASR